MPERIAGLLLLIAAGLLRPGPANAAQCIPGADELAAHIRDGLWHYSAVTDDQPPIVRVVAAASIDPGPRRATIRSGNRDLEPGRRVRDDAAGGAEAWIDLDTPSRGSAMPSAGHAQDRESGQRARIAQGLTAPPFVGGDHRESSIPYAD